MRARRYTFVIADRHTGAVRRLTISLWPTLASVACLFALPVLIGLGALASLRSVLPPAAWAADWRDAHRLDNLRQRLGDGLWAQGLARVTDADRELVNHLLTGTLSA